jgi:hypothetical protein
VFGSSYGYDIYKKIRGCDVRVNFKMLKVKVPIIFLGTVSFSLRRMDVNVGPFKKKECLTASGKDSYQPQPQLTPGA